MVVCEYNPISDWNSYYIWGEMESLSGLNTYHLVNFLDEFNEYEQLLITEQKR